MSAEPVGHVMWSPDPVKQRLAVSTDALNKGEYEPVADSATELVLNEPFEITLPIRDITP